MRRGQTRGEHRKRRAKPRGRVRGTAGASGARDGPVGGELPKVGLGLLGNMCVIGWVVGESSQPIPPPSPSPSCSMRPDPSDPQEKYRLGKKLAIARLFSSAPKPPRAPRGGFFLEGGVPPVDQGKLRPHLDGEGRRPRGP